MKNPSNYPIESFARLKKITTLIFKKSIALIVKSKFLSAIYMCLLNFRKRKISGAAFYPTGYCTSGFFSLHPFSESFVSTIFLYLQVSWRQSVQYVPFRHYPFQKTLWHFLKNRHFSGKILPDIKNQSILVTYNHHKYHFLNTLNFEKSINNCVTPSCIKKLQIIAHFFI